MSRQRLGVALIFCTAGVLLLMTRVYQIIAVSVDASVTYHYSPSMAGVGAVAAVVAFASAYCFATAEIGVLRGVAVFPAAIALLLVAVAHDTMRNRVVITPLSFLLRERGIVLRRHTPVSIRDLARVRVIENAGEEGYTVEFIRKDGSSLRVPFGDLLRRGWSDVVTQLEAHQVPISEPQ